MPIVHWPSVHYGLLVSKARVMPWFVRTAVRHGGDTPSMSDSDKALCTDLTISEFAGLEASGALSDAFRDPDNLEYFWDELNHVGALEGVFTVLPEGVPEGEELEPIGEDYVPNVQAEFDCEDVLSVALDNGRSLFGAAYPDYAAIESEIRRKLDGMDVVLPGEFPLWKCIGCVAGVVYGD